MSTIAQSPYTPGGIPSQRALAVLNDFAMPGSQDENSIATTRARVSGIARGEHAPSRFCEGWRGGADMQLTQRPVGSDTAAQGEEVMK